MKIFNRFIALLLIPCLVVEPAAEAAMRDAQCVERPTENYSTRCALRITHYAFESQALAESLAAFPRSLVNRGSWMRLCVLGAGLAAFASLVRAQTPPSATGPTPTIEVFNDMTRSRGGYPWYQFGTLDGSVEGGRWRFGALLESGVTVTTDAVEKVVLPKFRLGIDPTKSVTLWFRQSADAKHHPTSVGVVKRLNAGKLTAAPEIWWSSSLQEEGRKQAWLFFAPVTMGLRGATLTLTPGLYETPGPKGAWDWQGLGDIAFGRGKRFHGLGGRNFGAAGGTFYTPDNGKNRAGFGIDILSHVSAGGYFFSDSLKHLKVGMGFWLHFKWTKPPAMLAPRSLRKPREAAA